MKLKRIKKFITDKKYSFLTVINMTGIGVVCITVLMTSVLFLAYFYEESQERAIQTLGQELEQLNQQMQAHIMEMYSLTEQLASDSKLGVSLEKYNSDDIVESQEGKQMMDYIVQRTMKFNRMIDNITICTDKNVIQYNYFSMVKGNDIAAMKQEEWFQDLMEEKRTEVFTKNTIYNRTNKTNETYFLWATKFRTTLYADRKEEDRTIIITFRLEHIRNLMDNIGKTRNINLLLYYLPDDSVLYQVIVNEEQFGTDKIEWKNRKDNFVVLDYANKENGLRLVGLVERAAFFGAIEFVQPWLLGATVVILLVTIGISIHTFNSISRPMKTVVDALDTVETSGFQKLDVNSNYRETEQLVHTYNEMTERIHELILNIEKKEKEKRKEEYRVLEAQINPHFIYNTLDAIRWVALINHSKPTAEVISSFVKFLRLTLSKGKEMITVSEEIELTKEYINIMVFRNNYDINVEYVLDDSVKDLLTLKLIIQPFVENCFVHAFEHGKKVKKIVISTMKEDNNLIVEVEDNGKGIVYGDMKTNKRTTTGVGLYNVDERIKLWHGEKYGIQVIPLKSGTRIKIIQPLMEKGEYDYDSGNDH